MNFANLTNSMSMSMSGNSLQMASMGSIFLLVFASPLLEEFVFRAGLQAWLFRQADLNFCSSKTFIVISLLIAAVFTVLHFPVHGLQALGIFLFALFNGFVYTRTRSWRLCVAIHMVANGLWLGLPFQS
jgi:membrane protease YdiL (CAAX protease family)